jgi:hypothetical protein
VAEGTREHSRVIGGMSTRASTSATTLRGRWLSIVRVTWALVAVSALGLFVASIPAYVSNITEFGQADWMGAPVEAPAALVLALDLLGVLASVTGALVCLTLGLVLFWRRSDDWMVVFTSAYLLLYGTIMAGPLEWALNFSTLAVDVLQPLLLTTPTVALIVLFPDGRFVPRWTRWLVLSSIALVAAIFYLTLAYWGVFMVAILLSAIYAQVYRYRRVSTPTERQQTKWVLFGFLLWWLLIMVEGVPYAIELNLPPGNPLPWWTLVSSAGWWLTLTIVPLSLSIAVLRYRLYEIDVIINRALVYGSLTAMLIALYFGGIVVLQRLFVALTGQQSTLAVVASTLAIAALFNPLRGRVQSFVDRRFYRRKYDASKTLEAFSAKLRDATDLGALSGDLKAVVGETMQPSHVSLWLRTSRRVVEDEEETAIFRVS